MHYLFWVVGVAHFGKLAFSLGRNDERPNIELALQLCDENNVEGIDEIIAGLFNKDRRIANDCIKVLYEIGERKPILIADYADEFLKLLTSRNNRLVWGSMTALSTIAEIVPDVIYAKRYLLLDALENGSVITVDNCISVMAKLCKVNKSYYEELFPILSEHLKNCRPKEVAQHAARIAICVNKDYSDEFIAVLDERLEYLSSSQKSRLQKLKKNFIENQCLSRVDNKQKIDYHILTITTPRR